MPLVRACRAAPFRGAEPCGRFSGAAGRRAGRRRSTRGPLCLPDPAGHSPARAGIATMPDAPAPIAPSAHRSRWRPGHGSPSNAPGRPGRTDLARTAHAEPGSRRPAGTMPPARRPPAHSAGPGTGRAAPPRYTRTHARTTPETAEQSAAVPARSATGPTARRRTTRPPAGDSA